MQIKNKEDELKLLQDNITNLNQGLESLQLKYDKEVAEHQRLSNELIRINSESKVQISEKSSLERQVSYLIIGNNFFLYNKKINCGFQILEYKTKFHKSETNIKTLKELVTVQDEQLQSFEETILTFKNKEKQFLEDIKTKQVYIMLMF